MSTLHHIYPIGTTYESRGKHSDVWTVVDQLTTKNSAGDVVEVRYIASRTMGGQTILDRTVRNATIAMGQA